MLGLLMLDLDGPHVYIFFLVLEGEATNGKSDDANDYEQNANDR